MTNAKISQLAAQLAKASVDHESTQAVTSVEPNLTVEEAYHVQLANVQAQLDQGHVIVGKKIGLTSKAMQESLGVDEPDYGHLFDNMEVTSANPVISFDKLLQPRVEGELAFILKDDLVGPNITTEDVLKATAFIVPAIEIVDSRIKDWKITLADTVADNGSSAFYILSDKRFKPEEIDRVGVTMKLYKNGQFVNEGNGAAVLGDPAYCVAWLANKLAQFDIQLKAGEVILSGALSAAIAANPGDAFTCEFSEGLGDVAIRFEG
jgi:2-keto-4-pentenoate hydratase